MRKTTKLLFKGSIQKEYDIYVARDFEQEKYLAYGDTLEICQKEITKNIKHRIVGNKYKIEFYKKMANVDFAVFTI